MQRDSSNDPATLRSKSRSAIGMSREQATAITPVKDMRSPADDTVRLEDLLPKRTSSKLGSGSGDSSSKRKAAQRAAKSVKAPSAWDSGSKPSQGSAA